MKKYYKCIKDNQGGNFLEDNYLTIKEWKEKAIDIFKCGDDIGAIETIKELKGKKILDFICDYLDIEIQSINYQIKIITWYHNTNNKEDYYLLYEKRDHILVQNCITKLYSFGMIWDFDTLYGFPVNQSCLSQYECIKLLEDFIEIDKQYNDPCRTTILYNEMIDRIKNI